MNIEEFIKRECKTCNKVLETDEEWKECFDKNHDIHVQGQFIVPASKF